MVFGDPQVDQAAALRDVGIVNTVMVVAALALSLWSLATERRTARQSSANRSVSSP